MENIENKSLKNLILSKKKILFSLAGLLLLVIVFFWWTDNSNKNKRAINSEDFITAKIFLSQNENEKSLEILKNIIMKNDAVYSPLSLFIIIDKDLEKNRENIIKYFNQILLIKSLEKEDLNLLKLKKAIYISEDADEKELLDLLNPVVNSKSVWKYEALKLLGDYYFNQKQYSKAKQYYSDILILDNSIIDMRDINRKMKIMKND
tara:strand:- start:106 stop:723 length:618 start_codon:yes stop_codon:yes gene_type:complete